jgi:hypothetical protein
MVHKRRFAVINVGNDGYVSDIVSALHTLLTLLNFSVMTRDVSATGIEKNASDSLNCRGKTTNYHPAHISELINILKCEEISNENSCQPDAFIP